MITRTHNKLHSARLKRLVTMIDAMTAEAWDDYAEMRVPKREDMATIAADLECAAAAIERANAALVVMKV